MSLDESGEHLEVHAWCTDRGIERIDVGPAHLASDDLFADETLDQLHAHLQYTGPVEDAPRRVMVADDISGGWSLTGATGDLLREDEPLYLYVEYDDPTIVGNDIVVVPDELGAESVAVAPVGPDAAKPARTLTREEFAESRESCAPRLADTALFIGYMASPFAVLAALGAVIRMRRRHAPSRTDPVVRD